MILALGCTKNDMYGMKRLLEQSETLIETPAPLVSILNSTDGKAVLEKIITYFGLFNANKCIQSNKQLYQWFSSDNHAAIDTYKKILNCKYYPKKWYLMYDHIYAGKTYIVESLLNEKTKLNFTTQLLNAKDMLGRNFLDISLGERYHSIASLLLDHGVKTNVNPKSIQPLARAIYDGDIMIVQKLLKIICANHKKIECTANLYLAAIRGHDKIAQLLLNNGANIHATDPSKNTVLMYAAGSGKIDIVKLLIDNGAKINATNKTGETALMRAAIYGEFDIARLLINQGATIDATTHKGGTALMLASRMGYADIVNLLLAEGANADMKHNAGKTASIFASESGHTEIAEWLKGQL